MKQLPQNPPPHVPPHTCASVLPVASPWWHRTATECRGHGKLPGSALDLASLDSSVALVFSMLEGARGPSHGCFVPVMDSSQESR